MIKHTLKKWEKKYGYVGLSRDERKAFAKLKGKRFTVNVNGEVLYERHFDPRGRIYFSKNAFKALNIGDKLTVSLSDDGLVIEKG